MKTDKDLNFTVDFPLIDLIVVYCHFGIVNRLTYWGGKCSVANGTHCSIGELTDIEINDLLFKRIVGHVANHF